MMSLELNGEKKRIGLALSGGGFRAAAFHLGVFHTLKRRNLLNKLDVISCVSGGSIAGAFLAKNWNSADVLEDLSKYLLTRSVAVSSTLAGLLDPFESRLDKLTATYEKHLFGKATLESLSAGPRLYLNATNLATGNMFSFVAGENKPTEMGDHELGFNLAKKFSISRAVAASS